MGPSKLGNLFPKRLLRVHPLGCLFLDDSGIRHGLLDGRGEDEPARFEEGVYDCLFGDICEGVWCCGERIVQEGGELSPELGVGVGAWVVEGYFCVGAAEV